jgi:hypothetical protein
MPAHRQFERALQLLKLALAANERREPASRSNIEMAAQCAGASDLVNVDRFGDSFNFGWSQTAQLEITFDQTPRLFSDYDCVRRRYTLHP